MAVTPYVVGQWVRGERFYGRRALLEEILEGNRSCLWILGTRRIGKTSILKQLELVTASETPARYFPLFWDFQGSEEEADLHEGFRDALYDAVDRLDTLGIDLDDVDDPDLFMAMAKLRRELRSRNQSLLLLGDEVEELVGIHDSAPRFLRKLQRALGAHENVRTVLASTIRLWNLSSSGGAAVPFLDGFTPPLPVRGLSDAASRDLVRQSQLPPAAQPQVGAATVEAICSRSNNHPYLMQLLGERCLEVGDLEAASAAIAADPMVSFFFDADLAMLSEDERRIIGIVDERTAATSAIVERHLGLGPETAARGLNRLEHLGFIERRADATYALANAFFRQWFAALTKTSRQRIAGVDDRPTLAAPAEGPAATAVSAPTLRAVANRIADRYDLMDRLGAGATGEVFKANDTMLRTIVAVKLLKAEYSADDEAVERLRREVVLARDVSHPNVLKIYHLGDDRGRKYITMQYVDGPDLSRVIAAQAPFEPDRAIVITAKLAAALASLHKQHVLHRDVKPSNVLMDEHGEPRITDFGLARLQASPGITRKGMFLGTPAYASPEQASGETLDERSDLYALGVILFEMLTGRPPFVSDSAFEQLAMRLSQPPPAVIDSVPSIPGPLSALTRRLMARDRAERFQTGAELYRSLLALRPG